MWSILHSSPVLINDMLVIFPLFRLPVDENIQDIRELKARKDRLARELETRAEAQKRVKVGLALVVLSPLQRVV